MSRPRLSRNLGVRKLGQHKIFDALADAVIELSLESFINFLEDVLCNF